MPRTYNPPIIKRPVIGASRYLIGTDGSVVDTKTGEPADMRTRPGRAPSVKLERNGRPSVRRAVSTLMKDTFGRRRRVTWTTELVREVRNYARQNPDMSSPEIAAHFRLPESSTYKVLAGWRHVQAGGPLREPTQRETAAIRRAGYVKTDVGYVPRSMVKTREEVLAECQYQS